MSKKSRITLGIILILLAIQILQPFFYYLDSISTWVSRGLWYNIIITLLFNLTLGLLILTLGIMTLLDKKKVKWPLIIVLSFFFLYSLYYFLDYLFHFKEIMITLPQFYLKGEISARKVMTFYTLQMGGYIILSILSIILSHISFDEPKK